MAKPLIKINGAVLKNSDVFFDNFFIPYVHDKEVTVLIDECHEMNIGLVTELLTLFDTTENNKTSLSFPDYTAEIDFSVQSFIFATSEPHRVFKPFQSRLEKIAFEDYTLSEFGQIIKKFVKNCKFNEEVLNEFSSCLRGDAREAAKAAKLIESYLLVNNRNTFEKSDWDKFRNYLNIRPLGLNSQEIKLLKLLKDGAMTLTALASSLEMSSSSVRRDLELMLLKQKLISIREDGRHLTKRGLEYLAKIP